MSANTPKKRKAPKSAFQPGKSGNPTGRPKLPDDIKHVRELAREHTADALDALVDVVKTGSGPARVSAAQALLDRGWGKAEATVTMTVRRDARELSDDELAAIAAGRGQDTIAAPTSASEPEQLH